MIVNIIYGIVVDQRILTNMEMDAYAKIKNISYVNQIIKIKKKKHILKYIFSKCILVCSILDFFLNQLRKWYDYEYF